MRVQNFFSVTVIALISLASSPALAESRADYEQKRQAEYDKRGYTWPIPKLHPDTKGWTDLMNHRLRQVAEVPNAFDRFEAYGQTLSSALVQPNFTEYGFGLARAPESLMKDLRAAIREGVADLENNPPKEEELEVIIGNDRPWFIERPDLTDRVLKELQHYPEHWTGMELTPVIAYGFRLYRNNTSLGMHVDKSHSHIISFILHIDASDDAEPWPITIEAFDGNTHEVVLTSGDMLFYESSKCFHGRPRTFHGSWYTSVFVHYHPTFYWNDDPSIDRSEEKYIAVPPHWDQEPKTMFEQKLDVIGTTFKEPRCEHNWCNSEHSIKWSGPGQDGYWIAADGQKRKFDPSKPLECVDWDTRCSEWATWNNGTECRRNLQYMLTHCKLSCKACEKDRPRTS